MSAHGIELLVTKNAGGSDAKLVAASAARLPVVMVQRPQIVAEHSFTNAKDTLAWLTSVRR
jgi:precorrin-6A/cobalt-precorrin-6A reductase